MPAIGMHFFDLCIYDTKAADIKGLAKNLAILDEVLTLFKRGKTAYLISIPVGRFELRQDLALDIEFFSEEFVQS